MVLCLFFLTRLSRHEHFIQQDRIKERPDEPRRLHGRFSLIGHAIEVRQIGKTSERMGRLAEYSFQVLLPLNWFADVFPLIRNTTNVWLSNHRAPREYLSRCRATIPSPPSCTNTFS